MNDITRFGTAVDSATSSKRAWVSTSIALLIGCAGLFGCGTEAQSEESSESDPLALEFEQFETSVPRELGTGAYLIEEDMPIWSRAALRQHFDATHGQAREQSVDTLGAGLGKASEPLAVRTLNGADDRWSPSLQTNITYCVSTAFQTRYPAVVTAMASAATAWQSVANVRFVYVPSQDTTCTASNTAVLFNISPTSGQPYFARAFFPSFSRSERNVLIDSKSFTTTKHTLQGILRHELGHTLGFRHEHAVGSTTSNCYEDRNWRPLTGYDSASVMHYPDCGGTGGNALLLTTPDRNGAACLYGEAGGFVPDCTYHGMTYSAHAGGIGWLSDVKAGDIAGTIGEGRRLEAVTVGAANTSFGVCYTAYMQDSGWLPEVCNGQIGGKPGTSKRLEAVKVRLTSPPAGCNVNYQAHVSGVGWQSVVANNAVAGTTGQSRAIEALKIWTSGSCGF